MKLQYSFYLLFLCILLFKFSSTDAHKVIQKTCKKCVQGDPNIKYNFCVTSLQAFPGGHCANLHKLGLISIKLVRNNITNARCHIKELMESKKWDSYTKACLKDCMELYSDALPTIKEVINDYKRKKFADANIQMSSVLDASSTCEDCFSERKGRVSPLTKINNDTLQLCAIALTIINMKP